MNNVFVVQHLHVFDGGREDVKFIGVYRTAAAAHAAVARLRQQPGFRDAPKIVDPMIDDAREGFYIDEYPLDQDHWAEGYVSV